MKLPISIAAILGLLVSNFVGVSNPVFAQAPNYPPFSNRGVYEAALADGARIEWH